MRVQLNGIAQRVDTAVSKDEQGHARVIAAHGQVIIRNGLSNAVDIGIGTVLCNLE